MKNHSRIKHYLTDYFYDKAWSKMGIDVRKI